MSKHSRPSRPSARPPDGPSGQFREERGQWVRPPVPTRPGRRRSWAAAAVAVSAIVTAGATVFALQGPADEPVPPSAAPSTSSAAAPAAPAAVSIGETVTDGGVTATVTAAEFVDSVDLTTPAELPSDRRFVLVRTTMVNNTDVELDLGCGVSVATKLVDGQDRTFDPIDGLSAVAGNPGCTDTVKPGSSAEMTWVYAVPQDAADVQWGFRDYTGFAESGTYQMVQLGI